MAGMFDDLIPQQQQPPPDQAVTFDDLIPDRQGPVNWSDIPGQALQNFSESAAEFGRNLVQPFLHPLDTYESMGKLVAGAGDVSREALFPGMGGKFGKSADPENEAAARAFGDFVKNRYGGIENFKRTLATDPVGVAADISMLLTGGGAAAVRLPGMAGRIAGKTLKTAGEIANPMNAVTKPISAVGKAGTHFVGIGAGTGTTPLREGYQAGRAGGKQGAAFKANLRGLESQASAVEEARAALDRMGQQKKAEYVQGMKSTRAAQVQVDMSPIEQTFNDLGDSLYEGNLPEAGPDTFKKMTEIRALLNQWARDPNGHTPIALDALKQRIDDLAPPLTESNKNVTRVITTMRNAVKDAIVRQVPEYAKTMKAYEEATDQIREIERAMSLKDTASVDAGLRKLQTIMRNDKSSNYGSHLQHAQTLENAGADTLMPRLAGQALNSWTPRGMARLAASAIGFGGLYRPFMWATLPFTSPRLMGEAATALGSAGKYLSKVPKPGLGTYQAGRAVNESKPQKNIVGAADMIASARKIDVEASVERLLAVTGGDRDAAIQALKTLKTKRNLEPFAYGNADLMIRALTT